MKNSIAAITISALMLCGAAIAQVEIGGMKVTAEDLKNFYVAVGEHFGWTVPEIIGYREIGIKDEEVPVLLTIAREAGVAPSKIVELRNDGKSWDEIAGHYGKTPEIFFAPVESEVSGPPFGNAYGHYKNRDKKGWDKVKLKDDEVVNVTNVKFVSEHNNVPPDDVIKMRSAGNHFANIEKRVKKTKAGRGHGNSDSDDSGNSNRDNSNKNNPGKGKGKGKGKNKG